MARKKPKAVLFRRKREGKTNYNKRLLLLHSGKPRVVVRITNQKIISQLVKFSPKGDLVLAGTDSFGLKKLGWNYSCKNIPAAYLSGLMFGKLMLKGDHKEAILDTGYNSPLKKSKMYAFLKGLIDAGVDIPFGEEDIFPSEERIAGRDIKNYAEKLKKEDQKMYEKLFSQHLKSKTSPESITEKFQDLKKKILG